MTSIPPHEPPPAGVPPTAGGPPAAHAPPAAARVWAVSLAWGWAALLVASGLAIALDWHGVRDALDLIAR